MKYTYISLASRGGNVSQKPVNLLLLIIFSKPSLIGTCFCPFYQEGLSKNQQAFQLGIDSSWSSFFPISCRRKHFLPVMDCLDRESWNLTFIVYPSKMIFLSPAVPSNVWSSMRENIWKLDGREGSGKHISFPPSMSKASLQDGMGGRCCCVQFPLKLLEELVSSRNIFKVCLSLAQTTSFTSLECLASKCLKADARLFSSLGGKSTPNKYSPPFLPQHLPFCWEVTCCLTSISSLDTQHPWQLVNAEVNESRCLMHSGK